MATELIAAGTGADDGYITVSNGKRYTVFLRDPDAGAAVEYSIEDAIAGWQPQDTLDESSLAVALSEPGSYKFSRVDNGASVAVDYVADEIYAGFVAGPSSTFIRPGNTTAYSAGDLVANDTAALSVTPLSWTVSRVAGRGASCAKARLRKTTNVTSNAVFRLHLYSAQPAVTNGDNGAWLSDKSENYLGSITIGSMRAFSNGAAGTGSSDDGAAFIFTTDTVYGLLEALAAYGPGNAETFAVDLALVQN